MTVCGGSLQNNVHGSQLQHSHLESPCLAPYPLANPNVPSRLPNISILASLVTVSNNLFSLLHCVLPDRNI